MGSMRAGFTVALIGPDGAGKTTVARALDSELPFPVAYLYMGVNPDSSNHLLFTTRVVHALPSSPWGEPGHGRTAGLAEAEAIASRGFARRNLRSARSFVRLGQPPRRRVASRAPRVPSSSPRRRRHLRPTLLRRLLRVRHRSQAATHCEQAACTASCSRVCIRSRTSSSTSTLPPRSCSSARVRAPSSPSSDVGGSISSSERSWTEFAVVDASRSRRGGDARRGRPRSRRTRAVVPRFRSQERVQFVSDASW